MPIPLPNLDDRRWVDLVEEGRALIPLHAPEDWTDHNVHDPGITLMDLFAWIAEMDIYQLNRIPDRHKLKFLALVGIAPNPPRAARTVLSFTMKEGQQETLSLPAGVEFEGKDPFGQGTRFRTLEPTTIVPGSLQAVQVKDEKGFHNFTDYWSRGESFGVFGVEPKPGAELYLGFSHALPQHKWASLYFTFADSRAGKDERRRLLAEASERKWACRPPLSDFPCPNGKPETPATSAEQEKVPPHHGVRLVWEILMGTGAETTWQPLQPDHMDDDTRALTLNGRVRIRPTTEMAKKALGQVVEELYYLRVRFEASSYDVPPLLQNVAMNAVSAKQVASVRQAERIEALDIEAVLLGVSSGAPNQRLTVPEAPVQQSSFQLFTKEQEWRLWELHSDFDASGRRDRHFLLDTINGVVTFGDGEKGRIPPQDVSVYATYLATRAEAGNLAVDIINQLSDSPHNRTALGDEFDAILGQFKGGSFSATNSIAASGGIAAETLAHAIGRAIELMETPQRAVTLHDYETLARHTPGVRLARVTARANLHPSFPCFKAPGLITLVILPYLPGDRPMPSPGLRRLVAAYLNRRRVVGTRVEVVGPGFRDVAVRAKVRACTGINKADLGQKIAESLNNFLHPLRGGPDGSGWPFGRDVYRSEILQVIDQIPGVDHVLSLDLLAEGCEPQCGNVCLSPTTLVAAGQHEIDVVGGEHG